MIWLRARSHWAVRVVLFLAVAAVALAQESGSEPKGPFDTLGPWKITNTLIFAIALGFFIYKFAPGFFNARSADIQRAIREATGLKMDADLRYSEIDRKMATLAEEVKKIRDQARLEMDREHERVRHETQQSVNRIRQNVAAEIDAFRLEGMRKVRRQASRDALALAEKRLRETVADNASEDLVQDFVRLVERGRN